MQLIEEELMGAQWITLPVEEYPKYQKSSYSVYDEENFPFAVSEYICTYYYDKQIKEVSINISADSRYRLWINGEWIGRGPCHLGGDYNRKEPFPYRYYDERIVTLDGFELNIFAQVIHQPMMGTDFSSGYNGLYVDGIVVFTDGSQEKIGTDGTWRVRLNSVWESVDRANDAKQENTWVNAQLLEYPTSVRKMPVPVMTEERIVAEEGQNFTVESNEIKEFVLHFGMIYSGYLCFETDGECELEFQYMEVERDSGREHYIMKSAKKEQSLCMRSVDHCYMIVKNKQKESVHISVQFLFEHYPLQQTGKFRCSDEWLNQVYEVCRHTLLICDQSIRLDSPMHQEPLGCTGDYYIESLMEMAVSGNTQLTRADIIRTAELLRLQDGFMFHTTYSLIWVQMLKDYVDYSGDVEIISEVQDALDVLLYRFETYISESGLPEKAPNYMFVDWMMVDGYSLHHPPKALGLSVLSAFYYRALVFATELYQLVRCADEARCCEKKAANLKRSFQILYHNERGLYCEGLSTEDLVATNEWLPENPKKIYYGVYANALAVLYDLCPEDKKKEIIKRTLEDDTLGDVQPYFMHFVIEAIWSAGLFEDYGMELIRRWIPMVQACNKGLAEGWHRPQEDYVFDHSHAWGGTPAYQLPTRLLGLEIIEPRMQKIRINPELYGLQWAEIEYPTPYGIIRCVMQEGKETTLEVPVEIEVLAGEKKNEV